MLRGGKSQAASKQNEKKQSDASNNIALCHKRQVRAQQVEFAVLDNDNDNDNDDVVVIVVDGCCAAMKAVLGWNKKEEGIQCLCFIHFAPWATIKRVARSVCCP